MILLPSKTAVSEKWLPAETRYVSLLPDEIQQEAESQGQLVSAGSYLSGTTFSARSKRSRTV